MAKLSDYKFKTRSWPPPADRKENSSYLIGFDESYQPYIVKYEKDKKHEGWIACTLADYTSSNGTAVPRHYIGDDVEEIIEYWADAPLLLKDVFTNMHDDRGRILRYD